MRPRVALALAVLFAVGCWVTRGKPGAGGFAFGLGFACCELMRWVAWKVGVDADS